MVRYDLLIKNSDSTVGNRLQGDKTQSKRTRNLGGEKMVAWMKVRAMGVKQMR